MNDEEQMLEAALEVATQRHKAATDDVREIEANLRSAKAKALDISAHRVKLREQLRALEEMPKERPPEMFDAAEVARGHVLNLLAQLSNEVNEIKVMLASKDKPSYTHVFVLFNNFRMQVRLSEDSDVDSPIGRHKGLAELNLVIINSLKKFCPDIEEHLELVYADEEEAG